MKKILGVLASDSIFDHPPVRQQLEQHYDTRYFPEWKSWSESQLIEICRSIDVALIGRGSPHFPNALAENFGKLRYVCHCHGTIRPYIDKILLEKGLLVTNWGDAVEGVAESAMALLLAMLKQLLTLNTYIKSGWKDDRRIYQAFPCSLRDLDVGLYGFGPIGRHMARMLEPFGAKIAIYDPYATNIPMSIRRCDSLRDLFATCKAISIHCGLNDATRKSVTREMLALLPQGGILINTARGPIVDEAALAEFVIAGKLLAAVDVIENEKQWENSPLAPSDHVLMTGHIATRGKGYPPDQQPEPELRDFVKHNLAAFANGQPLINLITAEDYDRKT